MHMVIEALGGTVIDYAGVYKCCGFPIITMNKEASLAMAGRHVGDAIDADADCLVVPCPLCHLNLDLQQPLAAKQVGRDLGLPVLHLPQLRRPGPGPRPQGAGHEQARGQADVGDRLVGVSGRRRHRVARCTPRPSLVDPGPRGPVRKGAKPPVVLAPCLPLFPCPSLLAAAATQKISGGTAGVTVADAEAADSLPLESTAVTT